MKFLLIHTPHRIGGLYILLLAGLLTGCNIAKHLPAKERLYDGTDIVMTADSTVSSDEQETLTTQLLELARPRPNAKLFGYPYKVGLYYFLGEPKKKKGLRSWFQQEIRGRTRLCQCQSHIGQHTHL